jgi:acylphosphatase
VTSAYRSVLARVSGRVQHVGFRWFVERHAAELGVGGWVRNTPDGAVEVSAEGEAARVGQLLEALRRGPPHAIVQAVDVHERPAPSAASHDAFEIRP